jgi:GH18 family chitinase
MENSHNILIGENAGKYLTTENYILHIVEKDLDIDYQTTMSEREYEMIRTLVRVMYHKMAQTQTETINLGYPIYHGSCSACRTGSCSVHIGYKAGI